MYFALDVTSRQALYDSLIDAMGQCGMNPQVLARTDDYIVFTFNRSPKVFRLAVWPWDRLVPSFFFGDSHTGGGNLENIRYVLWDVPTDVTWESWYFIANEDACAIVVKAGAFRYATIAWASYGTDSKPLVFAISNSGKTSAYDANGQAIALAAPYRGLYLIKTTDGGYYYSAPVIGTASTGELLFASANGIKWLCRDGSAISGLEIYGNDIVGTAGNIYYPYSYTLPPLLFPNAATWEP